LKIQPRPRQAGADPKLPFATKEFLFIFVDSKQLYFHERHATLGLGMIKIGGGMSTSRDSWSNDHKYFLQATVKILSKTKSGLFNLVLTSIVVFEGDPDTLSKPPLFLSTQETYISNVEDELDEAESIGHAYISTIR
jgi:hypothetical protein